MTEGPPYTSCVERFLRYVTFDTQSSETSQTYPSTAGQLVLLRQLVAELQELGLRDAAIDEHGYVTATLPATTRKAGVPVIGLIAHVDTSPEMSGAGVKPLVHRNYQGQDLALPDDPTVVLRAAEIPYLAERIGDDIVTASGTTLLGADNKAGVAEIMAAAEYLLAHPEIAHGAIRIAFTPDEEVGAGTRYFDVAKFGARCAYTIDGGRRGELEFESFSADAMTFTFQGRNMHPGYAKGAMVNAIKVAADFLSRLPREGMSPETTDGREGYVHPYVIDASVDRTAVKLLIRDFRTAGLAEKESFLTRLAEQAAAAWPGASFTAEIEESYRNMREALELHPEVVEHAREAIRRAGLEPREQPIRGGTDGSRLSARGLPTPNIFDGGHEYHSVREWASLQEMAASAATLVRLCAVWASAR